MPVATNADTRSGVLRYRGGGRAMAARCTAAGGPRPLGWRVPRTRRPKDHQRGGRGRWCSMEHCGNRYKVRALRARHSEEGRSKCPLDSPRTSVGRSAYPARCPTPCLSSGTSSGAPGEHRRARAPARAIGAHHGSGRHRPRSAVTAAEVPLAACQGSRVNAPTWAGRTTVKSRRSSVAISLTPNRSAAATTEASTVPSGRSR